jgi:hypothetical protein
MAYYRGPNIPLNNLEVFLDVGNTKSYTGLMLNDLSKKNKNATLTGSELYSSDGNGSLYTSTDTNIATFATNTFTTISLNEGSFFIWVKIPSAIAVNSTIFTDGGSSQNFIQFYRNSHWSNNQWGWLIYYLKNDASIGYILPTPTYTADTWYMTGFTYSSSGVYKLYINGILNNTTTATDFASWNRTGANTPYIKTYASNAGYFSSFIHYSRALSDSEILQFYNGIKGRFI